MSTFINRGKGSAHPVQPGGSYLGIIKAVLPNKFLSVYLPRLDATYSPVEFYGNTPNQYPSVGDKVICSFLNNGTLDIACTVFSPRLSMPRSLLINVTTAVEFDTFTASQFSAITYEILLIQASSTKSGTLRVITDGSSVETVFYGEGTIGSFDGTVDFSESSISSYVCSVKILLDEADTTNTTLRFARSFCFPAA